MELTIKTERRKNKLVVSLAGKLTYTSASEFDSAFADLAEDITGIRIDMSELHYLSSAGIRAIMSVKKMTTKRDITLR